MKRILTIQDVSCLGKCSLTVALPIISSCGVEASIIPTAVLSTHTMFNDFTFCDLTEELPKIKGHWQKENIVFDGIYTGYLGSLKQIDYVEDYFKSFKTKDNFTLVDPVMADNGKLYKGFDQNFADNMKNLCSKADIIVPNLTEASFMLKTPYLADKYTETDIRDLLLKLTDIGCNKAVLTGISFQKGKLGVYAYDSVKKEYFSYFNKHLPVSFHGTGDIFASTLCGALAKGKDFYTSLKIAVDYTVKCIEITMNNKNHCWYGVEFESAIPYLIKLMK